MDFARKQLEKYGWKEGQGLGRQEDGISIALKPKLKFDNGGIGYSISDELVNPWWQRVYDNAANNIQTDSDNTGVKIRQVSHSVEITTKKSKKKKRKADERYKGFIKTSALTAKGEERKWSDSDDSAEEDLAKKAKVTSGICDLTDEELFKACGGRTAHKGARHGLKMNAKLERIKQHEEELLSKLRTEKDLPEVANGKKLRKHKKKKERSQVV